MKEWKFGGFRVPTNESSLGHSLIELALNLSTLLSGTWADIFIGVQVIHPYRHSWSDVSHCQLWITKLLFLNISQFQHYCVTDSGRNLGGIWWLCNVNLNYKREVKESHSSYRGWLSKAVVITEVGTVLTARRVYILQIQYQ